ncbi:MAG: hypothetical protein NC102_01415 [Clostridium sp.]|nr:hypothetical protein [Clostridium sp.]
MACNGIDAMARVHLFNPENDLALAANIANYTPPRAAARLAQAGALLPLWYSQDGDMILCYGAPAEWWDGIIEAFGMGARLYPHSAQGLNVSPSPWGWSLSARKAFADDGFPLSSLPDDDRLAALRMLSHRRTASALASDLAADGIDGLLPAAVEISTAEGLEGALRKTNELMLKMPWSSSGRGVLDCRKAGKDKALKFGLDSIRKQGCVMAERAFSRVLDFAKLFECRNGECECVGTSVFKADGRGAYIGNVLANENERRRIVADKTDAGALDTVTKSLRKAIEKRIAPFYDGVLGVDMLVDDSGRLAPCIELNLRRTMGHVANSIADRYVGEGCAGIFRVEPKRDMPAAGRASAAIENGKLVAGRLDLIPENPYFSIFAQVGDKGIET